MCEEKKKKAFQEEWGFYDSVNKKYLRDLHTNTRRIISFPFLGSGYCSFAVVILTAQYISGYVGYSILLTISEPIFYFVFFAHAHNLHTHACTHTITKKKKTQQCSQRALLHKNHTNKTTIALKRWVWITCAGGRMSPSGFVWLLQTLWVCVCGRAGGRRRGKPCGSLCQQKRGRHVLVRKLTSRSTDPVALFFFFF